MDLSDFDYELPPELIAQKPAEKRDHARLLCVSRDPARFSHHQFSDLPSLLPSDCVLVFNNTRVIPARLRGRKQTGGKVELLLVRRMSADEGRMPADEERMPADKEKMSADEEMWQVLCKGGQNIKAGGRITFADDFWGVWVEAPKQGQGLVRFFPRKDFLRLLAQYGEIPLPPYIKRSPGQHPHDQERYQTVYARQPGAVAAPTAGLHFTPELLPRLEQAGIQLCFITLHVGLGTFQPIRVEEVERHTMGVESYEIDPETAGLINTAKAAGRKIIGVGTTTTRALEASAQGDGRVQDGLVQSGPNQTNIFMYPGYQFRVIDGLITNFHLPRSTLLLLVSAFAGRECMLNVYAEAVKQRYRFYSYGDAMLIC